MAHKMSQQICLAVTITKGEFYAYTIKNIKKTMWQNIR